MFNGEPPSVTVTGISTTGSGLEGAGSPAVIAGLVMLVVAVYLLVVVGLGRVPEGHERTIFALSISAAAVACVFAFPARRPAFQTPRGAGFADRRPRVTRLLAC